ncbi:SWIM zinc finger family protein [Streptomyces phaeochromogenes]
MPDAHGAPGARGGEGSEPDVESAAPGRPDTAAGSPRPGDVAREALRAARIQAERERTAARDKGVEGRRRRSGAESSTPTPRPTMANRRAAAQVRELADRLGDAFDLTARLQREESEDRQERPGAAPGSTPPPAAVPAPEDRPTGWPAGRPTPAVAGSTDTDTATPDPAQASVADRPPSTGPEPAPHPQPHPESEPGLGLAPRPQPNRGPSSVPEPAPSSDVAAPPGGGSIADTVRAAMARAARAPHAELEPEPDPSTTPTPHPDVTSAPDPSAPHPTPAQLPIAVPPRSMAAPGRDGDLRRTFPALPAPPARPQGTDGFAETWWGNAWVAALEETALDAARLGRGKAYARAGHVDAITVTPGLVLAYVHGSRPRPYRVQIRMRTLSDDDWERFLDAAAERPGHIAALLDKDLPQSLADSGVGLLPGPGDLVPQCSCPDSGHPCKHAAALCYQTARLLDEDPFVLLLSRGRGERELLDALSRRSATLAARSARAEREPALPGVRATDALAPRTLPPLPAPLPPPAHPEQPPAYPASPGGPDPFALDQLATDAAARAHAMVTTGRDPVAELTLWQDAVRLAATRPGSGLTATTRALYASLATAAGRTPAELARAVAAWRQGGLEGLAVLEEPWDPPAGRFDRARPLLLAADFPAFRPWHNHLTHPRGHIQLRLGHDGLWYAYESEPGHDDWWPRGTPDLDPVGALTGLGSPTDL